MFVRSIARRANYPIRSLQTNTDTYNMSFFVCFLVGGGDRGSQEWVFMGKQGARFEVFC